MSLALDARNMMKRTKRLDAEVQRKHEAVLPLCLCLSPGSPRGQTGVEGHAWRRQQGIITNKGRRHNTLVMSSGEMEALGARRLLSLIARAVTFMPCRIMAPLSDGPNGATSCQ